MVKCVQFEVARSKLGVLSLYNQWFEPLCSKLSLRYVDNMCVWSGLTGLFWEVID